MSVRFSGPHVDWRLWLVERDATILSLPSTRFSLHPHAKAEATTKPAQLAIFQRESRLISCESFWV
jgi:hypothetical protein